ncbi:hypothetical protein DFH09DRAFT_1377294 [Mycena vulgaris]|nr:hypothetical protein DFH09DRAFT_1377294 [Mycena vulgaris]
MQDNLYHITANVGRLRWAPSSSSRAALPVLVPPLLLPLARSFRAPVPAGCLQLDLLLPVSWWSPAPAAPDFCAALARPGNCPRHQARFYPHTLDFRVFAWHRRFGCLYAARSLQWVPKGSCRTSLAPASRRFSRPCATQRLL